ncbi:MAG: hypothetical protein AAGI71_07450 [Bacteroidota bacterium]
MKPLPLIQRVGALLIFVLVTLPAYGQSPEVSEEDQARITALVEAAAERLNLTPAQRETVAPILEANTRQRLDILARYGIDLSGDGPIERPSRRTGRRLRSELGDLNTQTTTSLEAVLTEAQMETWAAMQEEQGARLRARFGDG